MEIESRGGRRIKSRGGQRIEDRGDLKIESRGGPKTGNGGEMTIENEGETTIKNAEGVRTESEEGTRTKNGSRRKKEIEGIVKIDIVEVTENIPKILRQLVSMSTNLSLPPHLLLRALLLLYN